MENEKTLTDHNLMAGSESGIALRSSALVTRGIREVEATLADSAYALGAQCEAEGDIAGAIDHYRRSSELGNLLAAFKLANTYETGRGIERNLHEAACWWRRAAEDNRRLFLDLFRTCPHGGVVYYPTEIFKRLEENLPEKEAEEAKERLSSCYARVLSAEADERHKDFTVASNELLSIVMGLEGQIADSRKNMKCQS